MEEFSVFLHPQELLGAATSASTTPDSPIVILLRHRLDSRRMRSRPACAMTGKRPNKRELPISPGDHKAIEPQTSRLSSTTRFSFSCPLAAHGSSPPTASRLDAFFLQSTTKILGGAWRLHTCSTVFHMATWSCETRWKYKGGEHSIVVPPGSFFT